MKHTVISELPESIDELFENGDATYRYIDYHPKMEMNNVEAMQFFLRQIGSVEDNLVEDNGTQVVLMHDDYPDQTLTIDSSGLGDFFSHGFEVYFNY